MASRKRASSTDNAHGSSPSPNDGIVPALVNLTTALERSYAATASALEGLTARTEKVLQSTGPLAVIKNRILLLEGESETRAEWMAKEADLNGLPTFIGRASILPIIYHRENAKCWHLYIAKSGSYEEHALPNWIFPPHMDIDTCWKKLLGQERIFGYANCPQGKSVAILLHPESGSIQCVLL